jgi:hypothetical protein
MKDFIIPTRSDMDMGTPRSKSTTMVTLTVDGFNVTVPEGSSVMRASAEVSKPLGRAVCAWSKLRVGAARPHPAPRPSLREWS